jgi:hypothetical protein
MRRSITHIAAAALLAGGVIISGSAVACQNCGMADGSDPAAGGIVSSQRWLSQLSQAQSAFSARPRPQNETAQNEAAVSTVPPVPPTDGSKNSDSDRPTAASTSKPVEQPTTNTR